MPTDDQPGRSHPTLFCLHFLGGSGRSWAAVIRRLQPTLDCVTIDLPGFGDAAGHDGHSVAAMADHVTACIADRAPGRWLLAGHSMGAKVALAVARGWEDAGRPGLAGLVLVAGSPPAPEPMAESRRETMLGWFAGDAERSRAEAERFIDQAAGPLPDPQTRAALIDDVLRAAPVAWRAWLTGGSREDWAAAIGTLHTPALLLAGADDEDLGPDAQRRLMAPHLPRHRLVTLQGGHLLPVEQPDELARHIAEFAAQTALPAPRIPPAYLALINSDRVSARTRALLLARARPDDPGYQPVVLSPADLARLRAVLDRVLPQPAPAIDLAARIDATLADGDGWRYAALPADAEACRAGLATLDAAAETRHGTTFAQLAPDAADALLGRAADGILHAGGDGRLHAAQMKLWFEELRGNAVRLYVAHPATLARLGYSGIANGGDGEPKSGFTEIGLGRREPWEPEPWEPEPAAQSRNDAP